jgi:hypothetical protein
LVAVLAILVTTFIGGASASAATLIFGNNDLPPYTTPGWSGTFYMYDDADPSLMVAWVDVTMSRPDGRYTTKFDIYAGAELDEVTNVTYYTNQGNSSDPNFPKYTLDIGDPISLGEFESNWDDCWSFYGITMDYRLKPSMPPLPPEPPLPPTPPSAVPEPGTWSMMLLGLVGLGILGTGTLTRRRRSNDRALNND